MEDLLFTMSEAAKLIKTNVDYVHRLRKAGLIKCLKLGAYKVRKAELDRFLKESEGLDLTDPFNVKDLD